MYGCSPRVILLDNDNSYSAKSALKQALDLNIDEAIQAARIARRGEEGLHGPAVPQNPLARLIASDPYDQAHLPTRKAALARMRTARVVALRRHFDRTHLSEKAS